MLTSTKEPRKTLSAEGGGSGRGPKSASSKSSESPTSPSSARRTAAALGVLKALLPVGPLRKFPPTAAGAPAVVAEELEGDDESPWSGAFTNARSDSYSSSTSNSRPNALNSAASAASRALSRSSPGLDSLLLLVSSLLTPREFGEGGGKGGAGAFPKMSTSAAVT